MDDGGYAYLDPSSDESIMHSIDPLLAYLRGIITSNVQVRLNAIDTRLDVPRPRTFVSNERHQTINENTLAERFCIGLRQARDTLKATLQNNTRSAILPLAHSQTLKM